MPIPPGYLGPAGGEGGIEPGEGLGIYTNLTELERRFGEENVAKWSQKGGTGTADLDAVQAAIDDAESQIDLYLGGQFHMPLGADCEETDAEAGFASLSTRDQKTLTRWATVMAGYYLYNGRGFDVDGDDEAGSLLQTLFDAVLAELKQASEMGPRFTLKSACASPNPRAPGQVLLASPMKVRTCTTRYTPCDPCS